MKPASFRYHAPKTVDEAVALLAEVAADDGRILAGGQSLVPTMAFRLARPSHLVDINGVAALNRIAVADGKLVIGACVRHAAFHRPVCDGPLGKLLTDVVRHIAHYPIRNRGTFCGSLAHADPASEWCLVLAALDGEVLAKSARSERVIAARDFFKGIMTTALADDELLVEARLPILAAGTACGFYEFSRRAGDFALAAAVGVYRARRRQDGRAAACGRRRRSQSAAHRRSRTRACRCSPRRHRVPRRRQSRDRRHRAAGRHHQQRRIPPRSRPRRDPPGARTRGSVVTWES